MVTWEQVGATKPLPFGYDASMERYLRAIGIETMFGRPQQNAV